MSVLFLRVAWAGESGVRGVSVGRGDGVQGYREGLSDMNTFYRET